MKRIFCGSLLALFLAAPVGAAHYMKSHTRAASSDGRGQDDVEMSFEGWFEGDRAVINIIESNNEMIRGGRIFIAGTEMTLYDEEENTCAPWDLQAMMRFAGSVMESMSGVINLEFEDPEIEVLERKTGLTHLGRKVDYLKYRSNWAMSMRAPIVGKRRYENRAVQEVWYDEDLLNELPAAGVFMDPESFTTGYEEMDEAIAAGMPPIRGAVLKSITVSTVTNQKGKEQVSTSTTEVTELDLAAPDPAGGYEPPVDCEVVTMFPPTATAGEGGEEAPAASDGGSNPWSKVKVKNPFKKKNKKKDDG